MQSVWYFERGAAFFLYSQEHNSADCKYGVIRAGRSRGGRGGDTERTKKGVERRTESGARRDPMRRKAENDGRTAFHSLLGMTCDELINATTASRARVIISRLERERITRGQRCARARPPRRAARNCVIADLARIHVGVAFRLSPPSALVPAQKLPDYRRAARKPHSVLRS